MNTSPGLLYGGIQNSKDFPVCPYLLPTVWQYGDSEVGGWVYDPSLQVEYLAPAKNTCHLPLVTYPCHLPPVAYHLSPGTCHLPPVTYHLSPSTCHHPPVTYL